MNKEELSAMVADILKTMAPEPAVKAAPYHPTAPEPTQQDTAQPDSFVPDITRLDLRRLYLTENPADGPRFLAMKAKTPARLGCGRAGARYKTLTMLRFRADHAAAQDTVFSQVPEDYGASHGFVAVQTRCQSKDQYLTRPDLGRTFDAENLAVLQKALPKNPQVQLVIGDGLSSAAILANAADCLAAIQEGLKLRHIECGKPVFVRYCRVGAFGYRYLKKKRRAFRYSSVRFFLSRLRMTAPTTLPMARATQYITAWSTTGKTKMPP